VKNKTHKSEKRKMLTRIQSMRLSKAPSFRSKPSETDPSNIGFSTTRNEHQFVYRSGLERKSKKRALLLIDVQNDFIAEGGSLKVPGAIEDTKRVANAIEDHWKSIDQIFVTLDTHQRFHIAHPLFWQDKSGNNPPPFTEITVADVLSGKWKPSVDSFQDWAVTYVKDLEHQKKIKLMIWPEHCLVGSKGHAVYEELATALYSWEKKRMSAVDFLIKGNNALTENYSAFKAEVIRPDDPKTLINLQFISLLDSFEEIIVGGQALSHCVNYSVRDMVKYLPEGSRKKIVVLLDGCSSISGFESEAVAFRTDMEEAGVRFMTTSQVFLFDENI